MKNKKFHFLELKAKDLVFQYPQGIHFSSLLDNLEEITSIRNLQGGLKKLDIKNSIKSSRLMAYVCTPEKALNIVIVLDTSKSQYLNGKYEKSILTTLYLLFLSELSDGNVTFITFNNGVREVYGSIDALIVDLESINFDGITDFFNLAQYVNGLNLYKSLIFFISDFCFELYPETVNILQSLSVDNKVCSILICEDNINFGQAVCNEVESGSIINISSKDFENSNIVWIKKVKSMLRSCGSDIVIINSDSLIPLTSYLLI